METAKPMQALKDAARTIVCTLEELERTPEAPYTTVRGVSLAWGPINNLRISYSVRRALTLPGDLSLIHI